MKPFVRAIPLHVVEDWLENWSRWVTGDAPPTMNLSDACDCYQSPERNHHEPPVVHFTRPVFGEAAQVVERCLRAESFPAESRRSLYARYVAFPTAHLLRYHVKRSRWDAKRARAASLPVADYSDALQAGKTRLARDLWPFSHLLRRAA